jgi:hypothetical protein
MQARASVLKLELGPTFAPRGDRAAGARDSTGPTARVTVLHNDDVVGVGVDGVVAHLHVLLAPAALAVDCDILV